MRRSRQLSLEAWAAAEKLQQLHEIFHEELEGLLKMCLDLGDCQR